MQKEYLKKTFFFDYESPQIQNLISEFKQLPTEKEKISGLYTKVRDSWRYNPYRIGFTDRHYTSSHIATKTEAHCVDKAILLVSGLRGLEIPARLRLAKVSNHIAVERLEKKLGSNEIAPHGLVEVFFKGQWVKCSPAFNKELCEMYNVEPLEFDGSKDSVFQEYNRDSEKFMEYLEDYGSFADVPLDFIKKTFKENYPQLYELYKGKDEIQIS
ncbi:transglutaminase-like domain-containing protein [Flagellimonas sp.]|uniref:transglutaminase-like domain-containing protein n=1 Tax=Flagellimonas sp. TaxID=2058762 RepID=UPI003F4A6EF7